MPSVLPASPDRLAGVRTLAERINLSARTLYRWTDGDFGPGTPRGAPMPCHRVGRRLFFIIDEVERWLKQYGPSGELRIGADDPPVASSKIRRSRRARG